MAALLVFPPTDLVREKVAAEVYRQTGRRLAFANAGISFGSGLGVTLSDVMLSAPPGMAGKPLLKADRLDVTVAVLPFILREVKVEQLSLVRPVFELRVDDKGRRSWDFAEAAAGRQTVRLAQAAGRANDAGQLPVELREFARTASPPVPKSDGGPAIGLEALTLADVRIEDGTLRYRDDRSGAAYEARSIDARLAMPRVGGPLDVKGSLVYAGEKLAVDGRVDSMRELLAQKAFRLSLNVDGSPLALTYNGQVVPGAAPGAEGRLTLKAQSVEGLARIFAVPLATGSGLGNLAIDGNVRWNPKLLTLASAQLGLGGTSAGGTISVELEGARPLVKADLRFASLDLDRLQALGGGGGADDAAASAPGRFAAPAAVGQPAGQPPRSIEDLLKGGLGPSGGPQVRGFRQRAGNQWDIEPIDASALKLVDVDGRFQISHLKWRGLEGRDVRAAADLKEGHLRASITDGEIAGGKVRALTSIDARQASLVVGANLSGDGVAIAQLLALAHVELLRGRGRTIVTLSAKGASERELVSTLAGRAEFKVADGDLVGWNAEAIVASLARGQVPSTHRTADASTPFRALSGTFHIASGVARTSDLVLDSDAVRATGTGLINIVDRNVDLMLKPKLAGGGIEVPVRVAGAWDAPNVVPDVAGALKSPQAQEAARHLRDGNVDGALRSVLGNGPKAEKKIEKAKEFLNGFFNR